MCCNRINVVTSATVDSTNLVLDFASPVTVANEGRCNFRVCASIPTEITATMPVQVTVNGTAVPLLDRYGNQVYATELRRRIVYRGYFGNETTPHVITYTNPARCSCGMV